jgi:putative FmdB family regulatory protein
MPTYEYACEKCGHHFEKVQSIKDQPLAVCPKELCKLKKWGKGRVKKQLSAGAGLIFKGSGFYITDYRSENYKASAKKESAAASGGESKTASTDKPAAKKETPKPSGGKKE